MRSLPPSICSLLAAIGVIVLGTASCRGSKPATKSEPLKVAAAADLSFAFKDVGDAFEKKTGQKVVFSFGSTGLLAKQIAEGAPFDVFAAANVTFVDDVVKEGACYRDSTTTYARGHIVLWTATGAAPASLEALKGGEYAKIAIANPEHAPYGKAAQQALQSSGVWGAVKPKIVYGENVQQTLQFAQSGNADVAIVALSLATVSGGAYTPIDPAAHDPIDQALVVCKGAAAQASGAPNEGATSSARAFTAFVGSPEGHALMRRYGFILPNESMTGMK